MFFVLFYLLPFSSLSSLPPLTTSKFCLILDLA